MTWPNATTFRSPGRELTDCIKAAAVDMELNKLGHHFEHVHYEHLLQIARLKKQEQRLEKAQMANDDEAHFQ